MCACRDRSATLEKEQHPCNDRPVTAGSRRCCWRQSAAFAEDYAAGEAAWQRGEHAAALAQWLPLAEAGQARAQFAVGLAYDRGQGVERDAATAARWYRRAAAQELADAEYNLALLYLDGRGVKQDLEETVRLFRAAAERGAAIHGPITQRDLMIDLGALHRRDALLARATPAQAKTIKSGVNRLIDPKEMGTLFKAMALTAGGAAQAAPPPGF